jgi:hypothetical protein
LLLLVPFELFFLMCSIFDVFSYHYHLATVVGVALVCESFFNIAWALVNFIYQVIG